jgi:itaconate CoA-transferase
MASHFVWTNRSKESLALDLKKEDDLNVLMKVLERTDVLVQNLAPGAADRLGLSFDKLHSKHPSLIVCDISGYGQDGPYRDKKAYDLLIQSEAGVLSVTGTEEAPAKVGVSIADIAAGMYAYSNIVAAVLQRSKTGVGRKIDISMLESMVEWMGFPMYYTFDNAPGPAPVGASHATIQAFAGLTSPQVLEKLDKASIANASVNDMQGVWDHPQLRSRGRWTSVETPEGSIPALLPPGIAPGEAVRMTAVPAVGEHNQAILAEFDIHQ